MGPQTGQADEFVSLTDSGSGSGAGAGAGGYNASGWALLILNSVILWLLNYIKYPYLVIWVPK